MRARGGGCVHVHPHPHACPPPPLECQDIDSRGGYDAQRAYRQSKLANVLHTYELARRWVCECVWGSRVV